MRVIAVATVLLAFVPAAHAVLTLRVEHILAGPDESPADMEVFLDPGPGDTINERLNSFRIKIDLHNASPTGVRFDGVLPPDFFRPLWPDVTLQDLGSDYDTIFVSASLPAGEGRDVTEQAMGLFRAVAVVPVSATPGLYPAVIDPFETAFFDTSGAQLLVIPASGSILYIPEPAALSLLAPAALLALRRRRPRKKGTFTISRIM